MKGFNQKRLWQVLLIFFEAITTTWCWSYVVFIILGEHYDSETYYYDIKSLFLLKYTNYLLAFLIPFYYLIKSKLINARLLKTYKLRHEIFILNQCYMLILVMFLPHLIYWGNSILIYATVGYIEVTLCIRIAIILLYLVLTYLSLLSFRKNIQNTE